jgi:TonB family protein
MHRFLSRLRLALLFPSIALCLTCGLAEPDVGVTGQADPPTPNLHANVVHHEPAQIEPRIDWRKSAIERAPMSLTASDGSGLRLVSVSGTVVIEDPLAFCELHLTFENPEPRRREGRFEFDVPHGAALSRLAMRIDERWMEGEVVERERARETFESYIHFRPRVDPALLEQAAANRVSARVFPIQPNERKQIVVSYSQPLASSERRYRLPLQGLPELDTLDLRVVVDNGAGSERREIEIHERNFAPTHDLVVALDGAGHASALRSGELVAIRVRPDLADGGSDRGPASELEGLTVLFDTSASAAVGFDREVDRLGAMLEALGDAPVRVVAFDQTVELVHEGPARAALGDPLVRLRERRAFGASDLHGALTHELLRSASSERLLIWSDAVATAGELGREALSHAAGTLGFERIDAYASSTSSDRDLLAALASAGPQPGVVVGPDLPGAAVLESVRESSLGAIGIAVEGASWSYPRTLEGVAAGDDVVVFARFDAAAPASVSVVFSDPNLPAHVVATVEGAAPLVERAVARAQVDELQRRFEQTTEPAQASRLRQQIVELAVDNRLLTQHTALLVLESEAEFQRYGIRRRARAEILGIGETGIELLPRGTGPSDPTSTAKSNLWTTIVSRPLSEREEEPPPEEVAGGLGLVGEARGYTDEGKMGKPSGQIEDVLGEGTSGLGLVGLIGRGGGGGTGSGYGAPSADAELPREHETGFMSGHAPASAPGSGAGYGRGSGAGFGGRGQRVPQVRQAKATVSGSLDRDIVRRIVRAHINEVRNCYNMGLTRDPSLTGRVEVNFLITESGKVGSSAVAGSTLGDAAVEACIAKAVRRWQFPKPPGGGTVAVSYPFLLDPGGPAPESDSGRTRPPRRPGEPSDPDGEKWAGSAQTGRFGLVLGLLENGEHARAGADAWDWATTEPDNALALIALGRVLELDGRTELAARVYGSLIDLHPHRADIRRAAGERLEAVGLPGRALAIDSYRKAVEQRPDQLNGHRLLAWALAKDGQLEPAFEVLSTAIATPVPAGRFRGVRALLLEDRELLVAAALAQPGGADPSFLAKIRAAGVRPATTPSLRLVASWETDATDVDILVDPIGRGNGARHADVRTGFGPEAWIARGARRPEAVAARVRYFNRGAMGYALGTVSALEHDGAGQLRFLERPFVLMQGSGSVDLGQF